METALSNPVVGLATGAAGLATDAANLTAEIAESGIRAVANLDLSDITRLVNPIALYLGPVQRTLGENMGYVRAARAVGNWEDTALTGWVCLALLVAAVVLPFVPWQPLLQLGGLALLGPHMWVVGRRVARSEARAAEEEQRFREASPEEARRMVAAKVQQRREEAEEKRARAAAAEAKAAKRPAAEREREAARRALLSAASHTVVARARRALPRCRRARSCSDRRRGRCAPLRTSSSSRARRRRGARPRRRAPRRRVFVAAADVAARVGAAPRPICSEALFYLDFSSL